MSDDQRQLAERQFSAGDGQRRPAERRLPTNGQHPPTERRSAVSDDQQQLSDLQPNPDIAERMAGDGALEALLDSLEEALADGKRVPFTRRLLIEEERFLDLIDRLRVTIPDEVRLARRMVQEQEHILAETQVRVEQALSEQGLLDEAELLRQRLLNRAEAEAAQIRAEADTYARQVLLDLEERVGKALTVIQNGLDSLGA